MRLLFVRFFHAYYVVNAAVCASWLVARRALDIAPLQRVDIFGIEREKQIFVLASISVLARWVRMASWEELVGKFFLYFKVSILICAFLCEYRAAAWYTIAFVVLYFMLPQPGYSGPEQVEYLDAGSFHELVEDVPADDDKVWLIEFYTTWASHCQDFAPVFAALSLRYGTDRLRFGKVNIGQYAKMAERFNINIDPIGNNELPTLILFRKGKPVEENRLPPKQDGDGKYTGKRIPLHAANVTKFFELERRMLESRAASSKQPIAPSKSKRR